MNLSNDLISQFVKLTNDSNDKKTETTVYGTIKISNGKTYVQIDGSTMVTPVSSTADVNDGDRVTVLIKDHSAVVTGNLSNPSINKNTQIPSGEGTTSTISNFAILVAGKVSAEQLDAEVARINKLYADVLEVQYVEVDGELVAKSAKIENLEAENAKFDKVTTDILDVQFVEVDGQIVAKSAKIENLEAQNGDFRTLESDYAEFKEATVDTLYAENGEVKFANIDFSNIGKAAMEYFYAHSGLIDNVTIGDATISGELVGVTIKGDLIQAGTLVADKLVIHGEDGLYYKLNFESGTFTEAEEVPTDSLHGSVITAKSIAAEKISVTDLVAFGATIGGFNITDNSIYSEVKDSEGNTTRGIYMDTDGQFNFGDATNYVKYYMDEDGNYHLDISAGNITFRLGDKTIGEVLDEVADSTQANTADLDNLRQAVNDHGGRLDYVNVTTYEGEPCIELGESDSDFKVLITNTRIMFRYGSDVPTQIKTNGLVTQNIDVHGEITQGGYAMLNTPDGGWGLLWKGLVITNFIVNDTEYRAKQDMTWGEFIASEYNPVTTSLAGRAFHNSDDTIVYFGNNSGFPLGGVLYNGVYVTMADVIVDGRTYTIG